ncbi:MAG: endolytic transglycosylase MltG [Acidobacteria bacterium]|nr:endolytic transglycosylase MltG [Acidobacteriota bacterium]
MKWVVRLVLFLLIAAHIILAIWFTNHVHQEFNTRRIVPEDQRYIRIQSGASLKEVLKQLHGRDLMPDPELAHLVIRVFKKDVIVKTGTYRLPEEVSALEVIDILHRGDEALFKLTVPEGLDIWDMAATLGSTRWGDADEFLQVLKDPKHITDLDPEAINLEGYLLPETYFLPQDLTPDEVVGVLTQHFKDQTESLWPLLQGSGLTVRQWVTMASLIEKETAIASERYTISGVFHRRLEKKMLLQCDPTIIYALKLMNRYRGKIYRSDILIDHPYNTYVYVGLPPGPIASPGKASLEAALNPEQHRYLFFVAKNDGSHHFSETLREHTRAVQQYQR